jgi:hypothetical protein
LSGRGGLYPLSPVFGAPTSTSTFAASRAHGVIAAVTHFHATIAIITTVSAAGLAACEAASSSAAVVTRAVGVVVALDVVVVTGAYVCVSGPVKGGHRTSVRKVAAADRHHWRHRACRGLPISLLYHHHVGGELGT